MKVKICGVQDGATARFASDFGADFIGFVFADSKRKITVDKAREIASEIPKHVQKVGVFVNPTLKELEETIGGVGLDFVQLHGEESPEFCRQVTIPVIKAFSLKKAADVKKALAYEPDYYLFDSPSGKFRGGSGLTFNWELLKEHAIPSEKVILAGGLNAGNVREAVSTVKPAVVDVSSGVETDGKKDLEKIRTFIDLAKADEGETRC